MGSRSYNGQRPQAPFGGCGVFERFTDRARKVMALANQEAQRFNHEYIGTEHILLGLVKEGSGVGANVLKNLHVDLHKLRLEVERLVKAGPEPVTMGKLHQTPRAKRVIEHAIAESRSLHDKYVGTEHVLLGLLREPDGIAAQVLMKLGLKLEEVRQKVLEQVGAWGDSTFVAEAHAVRGEPLKDDVAVGLLEVLIRQFELRREHAVVRSDYELAERYGDLLAETQTVLKRLETILNPPTA
jgi:ATP-dependent Clp protease ATP-binding subunit ClpA